MKKFGWIVEILQKSKSLNLFQFKPFNIASAIQMDE